MKRVILVLILAVGSISGPMAWGQIAQSHPEFCGLANGANPPLPGATATTDVDGNTVLYLGQSKTGIPLRGVLPVQLMEIAEVCPLSGGLLAIFGDYGGTFVFIVDPARYALVDLFASYDPVISPNQRWIAFKKFYPLHGVDGSNEFMLYDSSKSAARNRTDGDANNENDVGSVIFPPGHQNFPGSNINLPENQQHQGGRIYWAPDSRAIAFEDRIQSGNGIVRVTLDANGNPSAFRHALTPEDICGRNIPSADSMTWTLSRVDFAVDGTQGGMDLEINANGGPGCFPHLVHLQAANFSAAKTELNPKPVYTRKAIKGPPREH